MTTTAPATAPGLTVDCPSCGSDPGATCLTPKGRPARTHAARLSAALTASPDVVVLADGSTSDVMKELHLGGAIAVDSAGTAEPVPAAEPKPEPIPAGPALDDLLVRLLVLKVLTARIEEADADTRADVHGQLDVGDSRSAYLTPEDAAAARRGEEDRLLGKVGLSRPSRSWKVTDQEKFTAWVLEHAPDEIDHKPVVRNSFITAVLASCKKDQGWVDPLTHEVLIPAGVELTLGRATLQVRPSEHAADLVAEAMASGLLTPDGTRALPAAD